MKAVSLNPLAPTWHQVLLQVAMQVQQNQSLFEPHWKSLPPDRQSSGAYGQWPVPGICPVLISCCQGDRVSVLVVTSLTFILEQGKGHLAEG